MERPYRKLPALVWIYGVAGLIPFVGCAAGDIAGLAPSQDWWRLALLGYSALILSFLGGGRWGLELSRSPVRRSVISLAMLPSLAGLVLLLAPTGLRRLALGGVATAHVLQWIWDVRSPRTPKGYAALRSALTAGAVLSILAAVTLG